MTRFLKPLMFGIVVMALAHVATIIALPIGIMSIALKRIAQTAGGVNQLYHNPKVTPQNQTIVRPSPDLAYSTCALDLSEGPVRVFIGKGKDYASAAFYAENTDNVDTINDRMIGPQGVELWVASARQPKPTFTTARVITLPSDKGLMLVRRLAPSDAAFAAVSQERAQDKCEGTQARQ
jgi:uncharacterized membrane protein